MVVDTKNELDPLLEEISNNLNNFIENINCLKETFDYNEVTLKQQFSDANKKYESFVAPFKSDDKNENELKIPLERLREYEKINKRKNRALKAFSLIPPSYIITLVSLYDSFYAGLVRCVYNLCPDKLQESNKEFLYKDICAFNSIKEVKKLLVDSIVDDLLRKSHVEQINWLEKAIHIESLKKFDGWSQFVELTERRNLFVHSDGIVSSQYISECKKHNCDLTNVGIGKKLIADKKYFRDAYKLIYKMAIMLSQIMINKLYIGIIADSTEDGDRILINNVYDLIVEKQYDIAIDISLFSMNKSFRHNGKDRCYIVLNLAQAYKWSGEELKCKKILSEEDTSMWSNELLVPKLCLEERFDEVYVKIKQVGKSSDILTMSAYREWPIFEGLRKETGFIELFKDIFDEDLDICRTINVSDESYSGNDTSTVSEL